MFSLFLHISFIFLFFSYRFLMHLLEHRHGLLTSRNFIVHAPFSLLTNLGLFKESQVNSLSIMLIPLELLVPVAMPAWLQMLLLTSGELKASFQYQSMRMTWRPSNFHQHQDHLLMATFNMTMTDLKCSITSLPCVSWHYEKGDECFSFVTTFIGFLWDIPQKLISLPEGKRNKFHQHVLQFLIDFDSQPCHLHDVEKIHGSLCHIAFVYLDGCSHLPSLSNFTSTFCNNEFHAKYPPYSLITDLKWWLVKLSLHGISWSLCPLGSLLDLRLYIDASTSWGIGVVNGLLFNSHLPGRLKAKIFAGLKQWLSNSSLTFSSQEVFAIAT